MNAASGRVKFMRKCSKKSNDFEQASNERRRSSSNSHTRRSTKKSNQHRRLEPFPAWRGRGVTQSFWNQVGRVGLEQSGYRISFVENVLRSAVVVDDVRRRIDPEHTINRGEHALHADRVADDFFSLGVGLADDLAGP